MPISNVELKNRMYYVYDEKQKEIAHKHQNNVGELIGFSSELIVFYNNKMYYVYDENLKEISHKHENNLSQFKNVVGRT